MANINVQQTKVIISVISDLVNDQRVHKVATTLQNNGYKVTVIGAKRRHSKPLDEQAYKSKRLHLLFQKGFMMYAEWNVRLFIYLLFSKAQVYVANDLDTLWPNYLIAKWKSVKLVYDSHEYFTEQLEIQHRQAVKKVWLWIEERLFPKLKNVYTVNESIAAIYTKKYNVTVGVIRNVPMPYQVEESTNNHFNLPPNKKILLTQGSGFNADRGLNELIAAMAYLPEEFVLLIIGKGLVFETVKKITLQTELSNKVQFMDAVTPTQLRQLTPKAFCGFSLDKPTCLNYYYSLPNKLFDYIAANVPVIASNLPEVANIVNKYNIGVVIKAIEPQLIANAVIELYNNEAYYNKCKQHCSIAIKELNWGVESKKLMEIYNNLK